MRRAGEIVSDLWEEIVHKVKFVSSRPNFVRTHASSEHVADSSQFPDESASVFA